jgi:GDP-4-dehydro-6-deoxy-D-mannose reductase
MLCAFIKRKAKLRVRILVTGAGGFVGRHLMRHLIQTQTQASLHGTIYSDTERNGLASEAQFHLVDLLNAESVKSLLETVQPDAIYHLAGQSSPSKALHAVWRTLEINIRAQLNLLQSCLDLGIKPRIITISSGEIYCGGYLDPNTMPVNEDSPLRPSNPYALSKVTQDMMGLQYFLSHQLPIIRVRPFNHTGPGQLESFVAPDFALQIAKIEAGMQEPKMMVGNLAAKRDFTDVRDIVRAYALLMEKGAEGEAYNVASNKAYSIQALLDTLLSFTKSKISVQVDEARFRPVDLPLVQGDYSRLHALTGWQPAIPFETTLRDLLDDCRQRVKEMTRSSEK